MQITVKNPELYNLMIKKHHLVMKGRALSEKIEKLEQEQNKLGLQIQKIKDQIIPIAEEIIKPHLGEFGMFTTTYPVETPGSKYEIALEYVDKVEEYKKQLREENKKNENSADKLQPELAGGNPDVDSDNGKGTDETGA